MTGEFKGSRKHVLDLISEPDCIPRLNALLRLSKAQYGVISKTDAWKPNSREINKEWEIEPFCLAHCAGWFDASKITDWWLPKQEARIRGATWDLLSTCAVNGRRGLLLVEAKAHEGELGRKGKAMPSGSLQSDLNDRQIRSRLSEVTKGLRAGGRLNVKLNADSHYQLANRIAWAWKLAEVGMPVILLYLGFLGDTYFKDYLRDRDHWQRTMGSYMEGIVPLSLPESVIEGKAGGSFTLMIRSLDVAPS